MLDIDLDKACDWITSTGTNRVVIQLPEGLKTKAQEIVSELERRTDSHFFIIANRCFGACDIPPNFKEYADLLLHFGHSEMPDIEYGGRVFFVEAHSPADPLPLLPEASNMLTHEVGLVSTVQHVNRLPEARDWLEAEGHEVHIGRGDGRIRYKGQVLGCNVTSASSIQSKVTSYLYVGTGNFHPLAVALETGRPVIVLDPVINEVREIEEEKERLLRQRHAAITRASRAEEFAILVTTKKGQMRMDMAMELRREIEEWGKSSIFLIMDEITPELLTPYKIDALVSTACPRLSLDDFLKFNKPILTPQELRIAMGRQKWAQYRIDQITER